MAANQNHVYPFFSKTLLFHFFGRKYHSTQFVKNLEPLAKYKSSYFIIIKNTYNFLGKCPPTKNTYIHALSQTSINCCDNYTMISPCFVKTFVYL